MLVLGPGVTLVMHPPYASPWRRLDFNSFIHVISRPSPAAQHRNVVQVF